MVQLRRTRTLIFLAALSVGTPICAAPFAMVEANNANMLLADVSSPHKVGFNQRVWLYNLLAKPETAGGRKVGYMASLVEVDCAQRRNRNIAFKFYGDDGASIHSMSDAKEWDFYLPDTPIGRVAETLCDSGSFQNVFDSDTTILTLLQIYRAGVEKGAFDKN